MRIILAPAKKMRTDDDTLAPEGLPVFLKEAEVLKEWLRKLSYEKLKALWKCNDKIARQNMERLETMDLHRRLTPAILSYDGIAYQYMAPGVFENGAFSYVQEHLRILSGFYGVLKPMDGVTPYRLEMQAKAAIEGKNLYEFWNRKLYDEVCDGSGIIINLASKEYSRCIEAYLKPTDRLITCVFGELEKGKAVQKGVYAKMARGQMVRLMAENKVQQPEELKEFDVLGYRFDEKRSDEENFVFLKSENR